jgi:hypothetical protein
MVIRTSCLECMTGLMARMREAQVEFHGCAVREAGITIYVACPAKEAFEGFSSGAGFRAAVEAAGLPWSIRVGLLPLQAVRQVPASQPPDHGREP